MRKSIAIGIVFILAINLWAQAPEMFRYQGRLVSGTNLVNATLPMSFKLYDAPTGGTPLYEDSSSVLVVDGLYSVTIGKNTVFGSLGDALTNAMVYLDLTVNGETLAPRERLVAVPYALNAGGDTTPAGTIVLSSTYPNAGLEAQGYSPIEQIPGQSWVFTGTCPPESQWATKKYISFSGKIWCIVDGLAVWSSPDGANWSCATTNIGWGYRYDFSFAVFNGKMWIMGGYNGDMSFFNDIWCSDDGSSWELVADDPGWSPRNGAAVTVFDDKLWLMSGSGSSGENNDVWYSADGTNWTLATSSAAWSPRYGHAAVDFQDKLWVIGGVPSGFLYGDAWWSTDGITWTCATERVPFISYFSRTSACTLAGRMYLTFENNIIIPMTANGIDWEVGGAIYWDDDMSSFSCITHDHSLWLLPDSMSDVIARSYLIKQENGLYYYRKD